jgi:hypothetical protein
VAIKLAPPQRAAQLVTAHHHIVLAATQSSLTISLQSLPAIAPKDGYSDRCFQLVGDRI